MSKSACLPSNPAVLDRKWLLVHRPDATDTEAEAFSDRVSAIVQTGKTETAARRAALAELFPVPATVVAAEESAGSFG